MLTREKLNDRLREFVDLLPEKGAREVAELVTGLIAPEDREEALILMLMNQLSRVLSYEQDSVITCKPPASNSLAAIRDSGIDPVEAEKTLSRWSPIAHRVWARSRAKGITQAAARIELRNEDEVAAAHDLKTLEELSREMAETNRKVELADMLLDRIVMVRGEHKNLLTCTLDEVKWLARQATQRATGHVQAAAFYMSVADRMKDAGATTVKEIRT